MLKGISPLLSPKLLATLYRMGHGDTIVLADAHFPSSSLGRIVIRADGLLILPLLEALLPLFELDRYVESAAWMMDVVPGDIKNPLIEEGYHAAMRLHAPWLTSIGKLERFAFYEKAKEAFAIVATGDRAPYANLILTKGVTESS